MSLIRRDEVLAAAAAACGVQVHELFGKGRHPRVVAARGVYASVCRRGPGGGARGVAELSWTEIARGLGRRHHSSVVTAGLRFRRLVEAGGPALGPAPGGLAWRWDAVREALPPAAELERLVLEMAGAMRDRRDEAERLAAARRAA